MPIILFELQRYAIELFDEHTYNSESEYQIHKHVIYIHCVSKNAPPLLF